MFAKLKGFLKVLSIKQNSTFLKVLQLKYRTAFPVHNIGTLFGCKKDSVTCQLIQLL